MTDPDRYCFKSHPLDSSRCHYPEGHEGEHCSTSGRWYVVNPGPIVHQATAGMPGGIDIQHDEGECVWCDSQRFRDLLISAP